MTKYFFWVCRDECGHIQAAFGDADEGIKFASAQTGCKIPVIMASDCVHFACEKNSGKTWRLQVEVVYFN